MHLDQVAETFEIVGGSDGEAEVSWATKFGRYDIEGPIGEGGMAEVCRARVLEGRYAGQAVALKRLRPELSREPRFVDLFISEADVSRLLHHRNVIEVLEVGEHRGTYYMAMDLIDGHDLAQLVDACRQQRRYIPVAVALAIVEGLLAALDYAHRLTSAQGDPVEVVHCDVSPSNLFVSRAGEIKLGDFGIAKVRQLDGAQSGSTLWGKLHYCSPEKLAGVVEPSADLWAAAVTLYELLTLELPFNGDDSVDIARAVHQRSYQPLLKRRPHLPPALEEIVARAFGRDASRRYQTGAEFAEALRLHRSADSGTQEAVAAFVRSVFADVGQ
jgi:serine/threonine-protein kinase